MHHDAKAQQNHDPEGKAADRATGPPDALHIGALPSSSLSGRCRHSAGMPAHGTHQVYESRHQAPRQRNPGPTMIEAPCPTS